MRQGKVMILFSVAIMLLFGMVVFSGCEDLTLQERADKMLAQGATFTEILEEMADEGYDPYEVVKYLQGSDEVDWTEEAIKVAEPVRTEPDLARGTQASIEESGDASTGEVQRIKKAAAMSEEDQALIESYLEAGYTREEIAQMIQAAD